MDRAFDWTFKFDLAALPENWDAWYLASLLTQDLLQEVSIPLPSSLFNMSDWLWGTYAYVIRPRAARVLRHHVWPLEHQVDSEMMAVYKSEGMNVVRSATNIITLLPYIIRVLFGPLPK